MLSVIDSGNQAPASPGNALVLHYVDTLKWDQLVTGIMYLSAMNIRILDHSSTVLASAQFNAPINRFFTSRKVVADMFAQLDQQNQHLVVAAN
ncbi:MAG TPA: hypothetical protein VIT00_11480 [Terrimicrobiaceae bacterium]